MSEKKYMVNVFKGGKNDSNTSSYRNVHKVEVLAGGVLSLKIREDSTILMAPLTWETCRIDEM